MGIVDQLAATQVGTNPIRLGNTAYQAYWKHMQDTAPADHPFVEIRYNGSPVIWDGALADDAVVGEVTSAEGLKWLDEFDARPEIQVIQFRSMRGKIRDLERRLRALEDRDTR